ncbi:hypothetical protein M501DRAFT_1055564 [Patellaria atrata CBS 101060]|uniref:Transcription factor TFIIIB component B'' Myb domain-containing protein n=1 Tax=Patellaria atrata CBS 101060 TaxID=1346257 RepID=A0A9P4SF76_9PEZI|nr:hypothetical protein M501DRAFT_1055564 [Patellaria atrata CBS 101060]
MSSFINKSTKKVAPKAPQRRKPQAAPPPASTAPPTSNEPVSSLDTPTISEAVPPLSTPAASEPEKHVTTSAQDGLVSGLNVPTPQTHPTDTSSPADNIVSQPASAPFNLSKSVTPAQIPARVPSPSLNTLAQVVESQVAAQPKITTVPKPNASGPNQLVPEFQAGATQRASSNVETVDPTVPSEQVSDEEPTNATASVTSTQHQAPQNISSLPPRQTPSVQSPTPALSDVPTVASSSVPPTPAPELEITANPPTSSKNKRKQPPTNGQASQPTKKPAPARKEQAKQRPRIEPGETIIDTNVAGAPIISGKKPRKVRKDKGTRRKPKDAATTTTEETAAQDSTDQDDAATPARRKQKRSRPQITEGSEEDEATEAEDERGTRRKRRKRSNRKRAETPEGAELVEIVPTMVSMQDLCRETKTGKKSEREMAMRKIDWDAVKKRREEEIQRVITGASTEESQELQQEDIQHQDDENAPSGSGPRLIMINGQIVTDQTSLQVDRNAAQEEDVLEEVEENDLTNRVTTRTRMLDYRRDPAERHPWAGGKGRRWDEEKTEAFYEALRMFGTDFMIISKMFPGMTRRQIKAKFVREERCATERVKQALVGNSVPMDFEVYKEKAGKEDSDFKDPREIEREIEAEREANKAVIEVARKKYEELKRQRRAAGHDDEEDDAAGENGRNTEKGKKGKKNKQKRAQPDDGDDVEIELIVDE